MLKTLMTFVTISAEQKPQKFPSPLMEKFKFMTLQPEQPQQHLRKSHFCSLNISLVSLGLWVS